MGRKLQFSDRGDYVCMKVHFCSKFFPNEEFSAQNFYFFFGRKFSDKKDNFRQLLFMGSIALSLSPFPRHDATDRMINRH